MRAAAVLLLLSLVAHATSAVVCNVECRQAEQRAESPSSANCHEPAAPAQAGAVVDATGSQCHDQAVVLAAAAAERQVPIASPALVRFEAVPAVTHNTRSLAAIVEASARPDIILITTQRRI
jgi:hypothetical protein